MHSAYLKEFFVRFLRTRHFHRHFRRLVLFDSRSGQKISQEVPDDLRATLARWAKTDVSTLFQQFRSHQDGLTTDQANRIQKKVGLNQIEQETPLPWWLHLWHCYRNPFNVLLSILALVSYLTHDLKSANVIGSMILLSTFLKFWQESKSTRAAEALKALVGNTAMVCRRDSSKDSLQAFNMELPVQLLVPGDVIKLSTGDMIPADCRVISAKDLFVSQAALTGESLPLEKFAEVHHPATSAFDLDTILFMGTNIISGTASALVLNTSKRTYFGTLAHRFSEIHRSPTAFQTGVNKVSWLLIRFMLVMVPLVFLINGLTKGHWLQAVLFALSIAVGLTPEMLPMIVTSTLAKGAMLLSRKKVIVKRLDAIQNFGAMNVLCTDKTGTLTQNRVVLSQHIDASGSESQDVLRLAYLNSLHQSGFKNLLDLAVLEHAAAHRELDGFTPLRKVDEIPFDFTRRRMSVIVAWSDSIHRIITKGALEETLAACSTVAAASSIQTLTPAAMAAIQTVASDLNSKGLRVVAVAYKDMPASRETYAVTDECELTLAGYIAFRDPPKESTEAALKTLASYGISVKVLTGDNERVTTRICEEVSLKCEGVLLGSNLDSMSDTELATAVESHNIFAKLTPMHKERIVLCLKDNGHVVGFMGDGINDAPALHAADIGISVDTAADIAKEAADIVLLEKSLTVLGQGILEGRKTFVNMLKYIKMTASSNFGNVCSVLVASAFLPFLPMLPMHLLVQNLLYDFCQTAIPFDNVDNELLKRPQKWEPADIGRFMLFFGPISSIFDILTYLVLWFVLSANIPDRSMLFQSGWFIESLLSQTLIVHMIRTSKVPFIQSRPSTLLLIMTGFIAAVGIFLPMGPLRDYFKFTAMPLEYFPILVVLLSAYAVLMQVLKSVYTHRFGWQ